MIIWRASLGLVLGFWLCWIRLAEGGRYDFLSLSSIAITSTIQAGPSLCDDDFSSRV
jgi:hypothetical protein